MGRKGGGGTHGSPNDHSTGNLLDTFIRHLEGDALVLDFLDHRLCQDINLGFFEARYGVLDEGLAKHGKNGWKSLHKSDLHSTGKLWVPGFEILFQEIVKLATVTGDEKVGSRG